MGLFETVVGGFFTMWAAFLLGVFLGWTWKPTWANIKKKKLSCSISKSPDSSLQSSPSTSGTSPLKGYGSAPCLNSFKTTSQTAESLVFDNRVSSKPSHEFHHAPDDDSSTSQPNEEPYNLVSKEDLEGLVKLVEIKDGGPPWIHMMDRSTPNMSYQAWWREAKIGPPQYRSRTVFEDATPELVRDFFWDDEFRPMWDTMLAHSTTIEECPQTGTMVVQWIRKFPFFCSDREYIIRRRIWQAGRSFYCVTKGVTHSSIPRRSKPRRVDSYYSSWCIRPVESRRGDGGQLTACEVLLFHHEDMGIPREIAKLGVRHGMWGAVKKIDPGFSSYKRERSAGSSPLSRSAIMAQITTKVSSDYVMSLTSTSKSLITNEAEAEASALEKPSGSSVAKLLIFGGAIIFACSLDRGLLSKSGIVGVARKIAKIGGS